MLFIHQFFTISLDSSQEHIESCLEYLRAHNPQPGIPIDEEYQFDVRLRPGVIGMQPVKEYRSNVILCAVFIPGSARFGAIYKNDSTRWQWEIGRHIVHSSPFQEFLAQPESEQMITLGFRPN